MVLPITLFISSRAGVMQRPRNSEEGFHEKIKLISETTHNLNIYLLVSVNILRILYSFPLYNMRFAGESFIPFGLCKCCCLSQTNRLSHPVFPQRILSHRLGLTHSAFLGSCSTGLPPLPTTVFITVGCNCLCTYQNPPLGLHCCPQAQPVPGTRLNGAEMASKMAKGTDSPFPPGPRRVKVRKARVVVKLGGTLTAQ